MGRKIIFITILMIFTGCADFQIYIRKEAVPVKVSTVLIGNFEFRNINFDPYAGPELREAIRFEFFKQGINTVCITQQDEASATDASKISGLIGKNSGDIFIKGVLSQRELGFLTDREINSTFTFVIYGRSGTAIAEGYFSAEKPAGDDSFKRGGAEKIVTTLIERLNGE